MSLKIRLARGGAKKNAHYRVVVLENTKSRGGKACDVIGHYHPNVHEDGSRFVVDVEKLMKWISNGAMLTETVVRLCVRNGMNELVRYLPKHGESQNKGIKKKDRKKVS
ncbi:30S ribosomal protein S16 [bacterium]|nr:30S ribosomal protein S16 [bacterium]